MTWEEHFYYDVSSPSCLRWNRNASNNRISKHSPAGRLVTKHNSQVGYYRVYCVDKTYAVHRIIWEIFNGKIPDKMQVDHIDRNPSNNMIENLRLVDNKTNCYNQKKRSNNSSGINGVHLHTDAEGYQYWVSSWMDISGKRKGRMFSINKHGNEIALNKAIECRLEAELNLKSKGINITDTHGKGD